MGHKRLTEPRERERERGREREREKMDCGPKQTQQTKGVN